MNRPPWGPLNAGVFLIILGGLVLVSLFNISGIDVFAVFPLIFAFFGLWLVVEAFVFPPANAYAPPRAMVLLWGAMIGMLGFLWFVGAKVPEFFPLALVVILIAVGVGAVGYSFMRASPHNPTKSTP